MFDVEKQKIEKEIKKINSRLQSINDEEKKIEEREKIINDYEKALSCVDIWKKKLKFVGLCIVFMGILITLFTGFSAIQNFILISELSLFSLILFLGEYTVRAVKASKIMKKNIEEYANAKISEQKDKELKLALTEEYRKVEKKLEPLNDLLAWILKAEELQGEGYTIEQSISEAIEENRIMDEISYDEEYEPRVNDLSVLTMKFPPESH